jgi:hypothetical protein
MQQEWIRMDINHTEGYGARTRHECSRSCVCIL